MTSKFAHVEICMLQLKARRPTDVGSFSLSKYRFKLPRRVYLYPFASRIGQLLPTWVMLKTTRTFLPQGTQMWEAVWVQYQVIVGRRVVQSHRDSMPKVLG